MPVRKLILLVLVVLLAFTAWDVIHWYASPESVGTVQSGTVQTLDGAPSADTANLEPFQYIVYHLNAPLQGNTRVVLSYVAEDSSSGKINSRVQKGKQKIEFELPLGKYISLDCEIKGDVGIEKITLSDESAEGRIHYPFRAANVLIPSAIALAVIFLFIYVKPLNSLLKTIDQKIIDPETRFKGVTVAYIIFTVAALLHHIYVTMYHKYVLTGATDLGIPLLFFSAVTFIFGKLWKDKVSWILLALLALKYTVTALQGEEALESTGYIYIMSIYAFFGCYGVGRALSRKYWKPFLSAFCSLWTLAALVLAGIGIYMTATGTPIKNFGSEWFTIDDNFRASFIYQPVTAGIVLSICMFVAIFGCFLTKKRILQCFYILAALVLFFAGALTGTRTAYLLSALQLALILCIPFRDKLMSGKTKNVFLSAGKYALLLVFFFVTAVAIVFIHYKSIILMKAIQVRGGFLFSNAFAEGTATLPPVLERNFGFSSNLDFFFNGRLVLWKNVLQVITSNAKSLLIGQSVYDPIKLVGELRVSQGLDYMYHSHNTLIQNFLELGIPGLLLYLSFIFVTIFHAVRIIRNRELPFWQRIIPIGAIICIAEGLIDNTCHVTYGYPQMTILYLFAGFTVALSSHSKKEEIKQEARCFTALLCESHRVF